MSWLSKKTYSISLSIIEEECIATVTCFTKIIWMKKNMEYIQVSYDEPILILCDDKHDISISNNPIMHCKT